jgi:hypothetical protein
VERLSDFIRSEHQSTAGTAEIHRERTTSSLAAPLVATDAKPLERRAVLSGIS